MARQVSLVLSLRRRPVARAIARRLVLIALLVAIGPTGAAPVAEAQIPHRPRQTDRERARDRARRHRGAEVHVAKVHLEGIRGVSERQLKAVLVTKASSRWPWGQKIEFNQAYLDADLLRIRAFYADRGYPRITIAPPDLKYNADGTRVDVTIRVDEGEPVRIESVSFFGFEAVPADVMARVKRWISLDPGEIRTQQALLVARDRGVQVLKELGHPYAQVQSLEGSGSKPGHVLIYLAAEPGRTAKFGKVEIAGNASVSETVIRRQLAFGEGDTFKMSRVLESQRRLYGLELFDFVNFEVKELDTQPAEVPVRAVLTEGKHRRVEWGVGYGTEDKARTQIKWRHVNFFGGARTAGLEAKYSALERGVRATFTEPYFFSPSYKLHASVQQWYQNEPAYELTTRGGRVGVTREIVQRDPIRRKSRKTTATIALVDEFEDYQIAEQYRNDATFYDDFIALGLNPLTGAGHGTNVALVLDLTHDTTLNLLDARAGFVTSLHVEKSARVLGGNFNYLELQWRGQHYFTVGRRIVIANRLRLGALDAKDGGLDLPFFKRFFLGGSTSLRGWSRFQVSPITETGLPIGGRSLIEGSSEVRFPIRGNFGGVLFLDYGNVWEQRWEYELSDLRYDTGAGLRYTTPIGPVRFDYGYQLNPIPGMLDNGKPQTRRWRLHFSIGQAF